MQFLFVTLLFVVSEQLSATHGAVKMLHTRVRLIVDYLKAVQSGIFGLVINTYKLII